jgi:capsular polysaccharide biosynthesis protein
MEEGSVELIDYLRVIWKRKVLIIAGTLLCVAVGVAVSIRLPETYRAEILIRIGKTVNTVSFFSSSPSLPSFSLIDTVGNLATSIPVEYALEEDLGDGLNVEVVNGTFMIKIRLEGLEERSTNEHLKKLADKFTSDQFKITERNIRHYKILIGVLESDIKEIQNDLVQGPLELENKINMLISTEEDAGVDIISESDPVALMMIQNRSLSLLNNILKMKESVRNNRMESRIKIRSIREIISQYQLTIDTLMANRTRQVGEMESITIKPSRKRNIFLTGAVGLIMFLFLAFFMEFLGKSRELGNDSV